MIRTSYIVDELAAGLCIRGGLNAEAAFGPKIAQLAEDRFGPTGCSAVDAAREVLDICGEPRGANHYAMIQSAFSGATAESVFAGVVNAAVNEPFRGGDTTAGWVVEREVNDFKENPRIRRKQIEQLRPLPRGESADHLAPDFATSESYKAKRFARKFEVDEMDLVDDDIRAITEPARLLGSAALSLKKDLCFGLLLANAALSDADALFHSNRGNIITSASLDVTDLDTAIGAMETLLENSRPVDATSAFLLVPPQLSGLGRRLNRNMDNPLTVRSESRLANGLADPVTGDVYAGSATSWYLATAAGPIEFGYRESNRPQIRSYRLSQGKWGVGWDVVFDVGAGIAGNPQGLQKNTAE